MDRRKEGSLSLPSLYRRGTELQLLGAQPKTTEAKKAFPLTTVGLGWGTKGQIINCSSFTVGARFSKWLRTQCARLYWQPGSLWLCSRSHRIQPRTNSSVPSLLLSHKTILPVQQIPGMECVHKSGCGCRYFFVRASWKSRPHIPVRT